ncbi:CarboxypepD_reg-like domain-containing protein [Ekhidna lutea]|uniref:CarboxypepD_reg-like domain-containing protein n=1 Tax=Ekhidna lutea TaxID=447679 RepID=A0A239EJK3_EKHLU|nr:carboxypeptidase-like regulatory domain-containing protein [Ekhidna lutea]SNS44458.1 CarboxypepD_reg-like domain-containing protein [Ekhidna lutea]
MTISLILIGVAVQAQRTYVYGVVRDSLSGDEMIGVHVRNIDAGSLTSTNEEGKFRIPSQIGDTLVFSSVGHTTLAWIADSTWFKEEEIEFLLPVNTIYLDEVVVGEFPEYERFKELIIQEQPKDTTFKIFGVPEVVMDPYPVLEKNEYLHPAFVFFHPVSALHHSFSKKEKEKRKMQQIMKRQHITTKANLKFTRDWVAENTKLEGDKLTSFIEYCDFSIDYLASATVFDIHQRMMALLPDFLEEYKEKERFREG